MAREKVERLGRELVKLGEQSPQDLLYELKSLVKGADHYFYLNMGGTSFDIPDEYAAEVVNDYTIYLSNRAFLEKWEERITGSYYPHEEDAFDDSGIYRDAMGLYEVHTFETHDGGYIHWDFTLPYDYDPSGYLEITERSYQAQRAYDIFSGSEVWSTGEDIFGIQFGPKEPTLEEI